MSTVLVLGANGRLGRAATLAFAAAGWTVIAQLRRPPDTPLPAGVRTLQGDARDTAALLAGAREAGGVDLLVHALNPEYTRWATDLAPLTAAALALARATGATLMLPGNVYNFGNWLPERLDEGTPFAATHAKAAQRIALEAALAEAARRDGVRSIVIRAGDFLGGSGSWFDLVIAKDLARGRFTLPGPADLAHAWAWLPDLAEVFVRVAQQRALLPPHAVLHYAGLTATGAQLQAAVEAALGRPLERRSLPWGWLRLAAPLAAMPRALLEMRYLWQRPHRLDGSRLAALIGPTAATPLATVVRACLDALPAAAAGPAGAAGRPQAQ